MVTAILILCIPITAFITGYFTLKAYRLGITHNYNLKHDTEPVKEDSLTESIFNFKSKENKPQDTTQIINEWLNGEEKQ